MRSWSVPLRAVRPLIGGPQPITVGVPFPRGVLTDPNAVELVDSAGSPCLLQTQALAYWPDGSVKWLLLDYVASAGADRPKEWTLRPAGGVRAEPSADRLRLDETEKCVRVHTGTVGFHLRRTIATLLEQTELVGTPILGAFTGSRMLFLNRKEQLLTTHVKRMDVEARGPIRATFRASGNVVAGNCRFVTRFSAFTGTGLARIDVRLHNPWPARHRHGLWDLHDPGSMYFHLFGLEFILDDETSPRIAYRTAQDQRLEECPVDTLRMSQTTSKATQPQDNPRYSPRAEPILQLRGSHGRLTVAVPEFWQQFPRALSVTQDRVHKAGLASSYTMSRIRVSLLSNQYPLNTVLQGGERKTHTVWLHFGTPNDTPDDVLDWVYRPARVVAPPEWYEAASVLPCFLTAEHEAAARLQDYLTPAVEGDNSLFARREIIDEYGWRNYGELYADHEAAHYKGTPPVVSHYNNQYDVIFGTLLQYVRTGDARWWHLCDPLARHVMDIDIYHTTQDRPAYNGGLFWHTDHYRDAGTATHRAYSRVNKPADGRPYGGGPSNEHNYTTGLLYYHYLTGNPDTANAVIGLADWVVRMDDGRLNLLGLLDEGPTGLASQTREPGYHGPGRGSGNSVNALLDAWQLTGAAAYLAKAEELIRRCIHPKDGILSRDLLNVEERWSYTVFLEVLGRYLHLKAEAGQLDFMYAYGQASLVHYARWMLGNEVPYFDRPEKLEYLTETWAAQDFRKAHVLRLAAAHVEEPLRTRLLGRGRELADRAWQDLLRFPSRHVTRALAIMMTEGVYDAWHRAYEPPPAPRPAEAHDFGAPSAFVPQRQHVLRRLKTPTGMLRAVGAVLNPLNWKRIVSRPWL